MTNADVNTLERDILVLKRLRRFHLKGYAVTNSLLAKRRLQFESAKLAGSQAEDNRHESV